jgi:hypothetical protein
MAVLLLPGPTTVARGLPVVSSTMVLTHIIRGHCLAIVLKEGASDLVVWNVPSPLLH